MITPLGNNVSETWESILKGRSGIALLDHFDTTDFTVRIGGSIKDLALDNYIPKKDQKKINEF